MRKVFIICPVRGASDEEKEFLDKYINDLESEGCVVHYPSRDTNQNDPNGIGICEINREAIKYSNEIHIFWKNVGGKVGSVGSVFDFGMTFAMLLIYRKKIVIINKDEVKTTSHKSFENVLLALEERTKNF